MYSEVAPFDTPLKTLQGKKPFGIVLSGGPAGVSDRGAPRRSVTQLAQISPVLALCYGMQLVAREFGGRIKKSHTRSYGKDRIHWEKPLIHGVKDQTVWMSHGDSVTLPPSAGLLARSSEGAIAAFSLKNIWAFQFHPEVSHTSRGMDLLKSFAFGQCQAPRRAWSPGSVLKKLTDQAREAPPPSETVFCALSGGVDSTVTALLLTKALGPKRVRCVFVDTGLLRKNEFEEVLSLYRKLELNVKGVRAGRLFLSRLKGVADPEKKRKVIGRAFIDVFKREMKGAKWLAQGTLYPDVIESVSPLGAGVTIKSHHNVGGLPEKLNLKLIEPLRDLFKDEVREVGKLLGLSDEILFRHPFPGPGLGVRIPGAVTKKDVEILRTADAIYMEELKKHNLYHKIWQAFCVLLPVRTVGVQGDGRSYDRAVALRAVTSEDGMTANWYPFKGEFLQAVALRIVNETKGVNRVVYDITTKPPGTIEWE